MLTSSNSYRKSQLITKSWWLSEAILISCLGLPLLVTQDVCFAGSLRPTEGARPLGLSLLIHSHGLLPAARGATGYQLSLETWFLPAANSSTPSLPQYTRVHKRTGSLKLQGSVISQLALSNPQLPQGGAGQWDEIFEFILGTGTGRTKKWHWSW